MKKYIHEVLGPKGLLAQKITNYQYRKSQLEMAELVQKSLIKEEHSIIEAGTGIGKSFAYLIPALKYAIEEKKRIVISTKTINLQEQLIKKDIPLLQKVLNLDFSVILAKGRGNYLCLRKLEQNSQMNLLEDHSQNELNKLHEIKNSIIEGDKEEINCNKEIWDKVCSESESCLKKNCSHFDECFFYQARKKQEKAQILIVNHALFFADLAVRRANNYESNTGAFADYQHVVFDEAHHIENAATDFLGIQINYFRFKYLIDQVNLLLNYKGPLGEILGPNNKIFEKVQTFLREFNDKTIAFFQNAADYCSENSKRLYAQEKCFIEDTLSSYLEDLSHELEMIKDSYSLTEEFMANLNTMIYKTETLRNDLEFFLFQRGKKEYVYWLEKQEQKENKLTGILLACAPISVAEIMAEAIFERIPSVILTSATLSINNSFHYLAERIGLEENSYQSLQLKAPFDYQQQSLLYLPKDAPDPRSPIFNDYINKKITELIFLSQGRAFVLFTSYRLMLQTHDAIGYNLKQAGYKLLIQGKEKRDKLLNSFKTDISSVLFGTDSFWEGVDVQGEALSCVIIVKLPFAVPDKPIIQARCEYLETMGKNPFMEYSVPQAVIKLKQGFGRLIRTKEDKGIVAILDNRLQKASYGKIFLNSLPPAPLTQKISDIEKLFINNSSSKKSNP